VSVCHGETSSYSLQAKMSDSISGRVESDRESENHSWTTDQNLLGLIFWEAIIVRLVNCANSSSTRASSKLITGRSVRELRLLNEPRLSHRTAYDEFTMESIFNHFRGDTPTMPITTDVQNDSTRHGIVTQ